MTPQEANQATRLHFAKICGECIVCAIRGDWFVNDLNEYIAWQFNSAIASLNGDDDHTFTHRQYAHFLITGDCVPLLG